MTIYDHTLPVRVRIGDRREWTVGDVPADEGGRVHPVALADLLIAVGKHMRRLVAEEHRKLQEEEPEGET